MNTSESFQALRRANPRAKEDFAQSVEAAADAVRAQILTAAYDTPPRSRPGRRLVRVSVAGASVVATAAVATLLTVGSPADGPGVENAIAAVRTAATTTAASAERSGAAVVRITRDGSVWAGMTVRWHDGDLSVASDEPVRRGRAGSKLLLVDGTMYGIEDGEWVVLGDPKSIDPGSGTTPAEYLAAVREDVGGATLRRIVGGMTGLTTRRLDDGSTVYVGAVPAGLIARESGFKGREPIRVLPFGYVAHGEAADPAAALDVAVTVAADRVVRQIAVTWGTSSSWAYTVTYSDLGAASPLVAPSNARPLRRR
jgi:hypothetical protein